MFKTLVSTFSSYVEHKKEWNQFSAIYKSQTQQQQPSLWWWIILVSSERGSD